MKTIICVINDTKKNPDHFSQSQIIHSFKWLVCFEWTVCERDITNGHHTQSDILLYVWYLATSQNNTVFSVLPYKGIYKYNI